ncbi:Putative penicillin-binding protein [Kitasatospora sp. MMS16-BH015]|uniref:penicillin-binding transpeptidase domain-containing protein n=1 Tax=Kitasatospora sp. MMS16-BH015 TaxID=2018025 RepID=UPI000CA3ABC8|nr:penicillin-binding transpeptidase domain-containing protein [Kitasatospora sp. MMS16-BH015]AUG79332.1 Putative penicillin-binding protein [Kitasatospora sp. MMS16-BH015]
MHKGAKIGLAAVCTAMLAVGGYGAYTVFGADGSSTSSAPKPRVVVDGPPAADKAAATAKSFLDAWSKGDLAAASALTDQPDAALTVLTAFKSKVNPSALTLTAESGPPSAKPTSTSAPTTASSSSPSASPKPAESTPAGQMLLGYQAKAEFAGTAAVWSYEGALGLVRMSDGTAAVHWTPHVIHPHLDAGETIAVQPIAAQPGTLQDRHGKSLAGFDSLRPLLTNFKAQAEANPADAGSGVVISDASGGKSEQLFVVTEPKPAPALKLTIDGTLQKAAEDAMKKQSGLMGGLVAIEPSTGNILAIANNPATGFNRALQTAVAPGSTMKVITAAALLEAGVGLNDNVPCKPSVTVSGQTFQNDSPSDTDPAASFLKDFAISCNTAFIEAGMNKLQPGQMEATAKEVFGLGPLWKTGLQIAQPKVPTPSGLNQRAAQLMGQGQLQLSPLAMASVAATVKDGTFRQPILVPGMTQLPADRKMSPATAAALQQMMQAVVSNGTAAGLHLPGGAGAKTGTAQVGNQAKSNSWFTAFSGDLAVAADFENAGHGADFAGPAVAEVLATGNHK